MSCSPFDLRDYFFGELSPAERSATESHLTTCLLCRDELAKFSDLKAVLLSAAPDEEPPRRIAFVSDKVFEPRWWQRVWTSGPQLGFASAAMLAAAILVHGVLARPVAAIAPPATAAVVSPVTLPVASALDKNAVQADGVRAQAVQAEVERRVRLEVAKVLAANESQQLQKVADLVNARVKRSERRNDQNLVLIQEYLERLDKRNARVQRAMFNE